MARTMEERSPIPGETVALTPAGGRLASIDQLRGLVILLMALDHTRDFFDADALRFDPTDLERTYPALFLTRFATHFCAPTFTFLAGVSAFLRGRSLRNRAALSRFLWTRGLLLIMLDAIVVSPVWNAGFGAIVLGALWALGVGMAALAALIRLPTQVVLAIGLTILAFHNLLDGVHAERFGDFAPLWSMLHEQGALPFGLRGVVFYPVLPWIGVIAVGYGAGPLFLWSPERRARALIALGLASLALFAVLRAGNVYGDPQPWRAYPDAVTTALSFLNVSKYPPSLLYTLVTLGVSLLLTAALERLAGGAGRILSTFGRVPMFVYVLHLYVILAAAFAVQQAGVDWRPFWGGPSPENFGVGLAGTYVAWIAIMAALYPACVWFAGVKRRRRDRWLSYL